MTEPTRRDLMGGLLGAVGLLLLPVCRRHTQAEPVLDGPIGTWPRARQDALAAAADRILPGAAAAGALHYMSYWLAQPFWAFASHELDLGAVLLEREARKRRRVGFAALDGHEQDEILGALRRGELSSPRFDGAGFYKRLVTLTVESYLADPKYGGNRDRVGWQLVGAHSCWWAPKNLDRLWPAVGTGDLL